MRLVWSDWANEEKLTTVTCVIMYITDLLKAADEQNLESPKRQDQSADDEQNLEGAI